MVLQYGQGGVVENSHFDSLLEKRAKEDSVKSGGHQGDHWKGKVSGKGEGGDRLKEKGEQTAEEKENQKVKVEQ